MDIERAVEFLLEQQAKTEARFASIAGLIETGMRMIVNLQERHNDTDRRISALVDAQFRTEQRVQELAAAQKVTEQRLQAFIDSLRRPGNGG